MKFGLNLRDFISDPKRPMAAQVEEAAEIVGKARALGFWGIYEAQHWVSHPTIWLQPFPTLARMAAADSELKLITGVLLLPLFNPVDVAEQVVSVDHISNGRLILGAGLGYREKELGAVGTSRRERVSRFEESITLMKQLWSGEEVTFRGQHWQVENARMGLTPVQKPHPPIWIASQSPRATQRAALIGDGCLIAPQVSWQDLRRLARIYWQTFDASAASPSRFMGAHRCLAIAADSKTALREAQKTAEATAAMYAGWDMEEPTMVPLRLSSPRELTDWAIAGSPGECAETIARCQEETGAEYFGLALLNMPRDRHGREEYLQYVSEELLRRFPEE